MLKLPQYFRNIYAKEIMNLLNYLGKKDLAIKKTFTISVSKKPQLKTNTYISIIFTDYYLWLQANKCVKTKR